MLNELYSIYMGLEAVGESPIIKHKDIHTPGKNMTFRVMLDEHGRVSSVKLMTVEQTQDCWSLGNKQTQFPAVKVKYPLLANGHMDYLSWKEEIGKPSEVNFRELIERLSMKNSISLSNLSCWPSYRKQVLARKDQLAGDDDCKEVYELFHRYSKTKTGVEILEQVATILIKSAQQGADILSLKAICSLLFGEKLKSKGEVEDNKRVTLMIDCFPHADIDIYASSKNRITNLSQALFIAELKTITKARNGVCSLSGNKGELVGKTFPEEKLAVVGPTILFSKNEQTSGITVERYGKSRGDAFSLSNNLCQKLAASILFINSGKFKEKTWSRLPSSSLLLAYCKKDWNLPITPLITGVSEIEDFDDYLDATESVLASFKGKNLSLDVVVDFTEIIKVDKANRKINFSTTAKLSKLIRAADEWKQACINSPSFKLYALTHKKEKQMCSPWAISPQQVMYLSRQKYIRNGSDSTSLPSISFADVMKLFLGQNNQALAIRCLQRIAEQYQPLLNYCALSRLQRVLQAKAHVKADPKKHNAPVLSAVTLMALLLFKIGRTKEIYMNDFAFQLGQLCSAMDELHIGYCKNVRSGKIPNTLIGNLTYSMALQNPIKALSISAPRIRPYEVWAKKAFENKSWLVKKDGKVIDDKDGKPIEDKAIKDGVFSNRWMSGQSDRLHKSFSGNTQIITDSYKAELMLGYLAGRPFEKQKTSTKQNDNQGENS